MQYYPKIFNLKNIFSRDWMNKDISFSYLTPHINNYAQNGEHWR